MVPAGSDVPDTDVPVQVSSLERGVGVTGFVFTSKVLVVFQHGNVMPVVVHFPGQEQTVRKRDCELLELSPFILPPLLSR